MVLRLINKINLNSNDKYFKNIKIPTLISLNKNDQILEIAKEVHNAVISDNIVLKYLKLLGEHDMYTREHSISVAILSFFIAFKKGYSIDDIIIVVKGALLHDIGKTSVPLKVLNKPGKLDNDEFDIIKRHSVEGYNLIKNEPLHEDIKNIILYHHSRLDGSGYPCNVDDEKLNENVQIVSVCDVFDALTGDRVYKPGMPKSLAYRIIRSEMANKLNIDCLDALIDYLIIFDVGEISTLTSGEKCEIIALNVNDINRPIVRIVEGENIDKVINLNVDRNLDLIYT